MTKGAQMMDICLLAGKIMLKNGAETYRVEETVERMAKAAQLTNVQSLVTTTGIFLSFEDRDKGELMQMIRIDNRFYNLTKVTEVNEISRKFVAHVITPDEAYDRLIHIENAPPVYPSWLIHVASGIAGAGFSYIFGGSYSDMFPAFIAGFIASLSLVIIQKYFKIRFIAEFMASFFGGATAILLVFLQIGINLDQIIIGCLMPLVPGVPLTNAVSDLISGDFIAGVSRGAEAIFTSLSIVAGIALAIGLFLS